MLNHQKLHCYQHSLRLVKTLAKAMPHWPPGTGNLKDQLRRAMISTVLNVAEGSGKSTPKDQKRFYVIARGSLAEVSACLDLAQALGLIAAATHQELEAQLTHVIKMLTRLIAVCGER